MEQKKQDAEKLIMESMTEILIRATLMGSAATTSPTSSNGSGATDTLIAVCKKLSARVEGLVRENHTLVEALYIAEKEGWLAKVMPHMFASMEVQQ